MTAAARSSTTSRSTPARRSGRTDRSRITAATAAWWISSKGREAIAPVASERAGRRRLPSRDRPDQSRTSCTRTASTATSAAPISAAAGRARRRRAAAAGGGAATHIQPKDPDAELRAQWMAPFIISPHDGSVVYAGYQFVFRSRNRGDAGRRSARTSPTTTPRRWARTRRPFRTSTIVAIAESPKKEGAALRRQRRRPAAHDDRQREGMDRAHDELPCADGSRGWCRRCMPTARSTSPSAAGKTTTSRRTSTSPPITAGRSEHRGQHSGRPRERHPRRSAQSERAVRRHRLRRLHLDERRRQDGGARRQSAVGPGVGPGSSSRATRCS